VHPTPIYEFATSVSIFAFLWHRRCDAKPHTQMAWANLLLGICRFYVEFVRRHDKDGILGLTMYQLIAIGQALAGILQLAVAPMLQYGSDATEEAEEKEKKMN